MPSRLRKIERDCCAVVAASRSSVLSTPPTEIQQEVGPREKLVRWACLLSGRIAFFGWNQGDCRFTVCQYCHARVRCSGDHYPLLDGDKELEAPWNQP